MGSEEMVRKSNKTVWVSGDGKRKRKRKQNKNPSRLDRVLSKAGCVMLHELKEYNFTTQTHNHSVTMVYSYFTNLLTRTLVCSACKNTLGTHSSSSYSALSIRALFLDFLTDCVSSSILRSHFSSTAVTSILTR